MQTGNLNCFFCLIHDKMASHNLPNVTELFFKERLSQSFALLQVEFCHGTYTDFYILIFV